MKHKLAILAITAVLSTGVVLAAGPTNSQPAHGWQLMTPQEWAAHRATMRSLPPEQRAAYLARHHAEMQKRAEAQGLTLPERPLTARAGPRGRAGGFGPGYGMHGRGCRFQ